MSETIIGALIKRGGRAALGATAALAMFGVTSHAFADPPVSLAPPTQSADSTDSDSAPIDASSDTVFQWSEVPQNQKILLTRAVFDRNGYQLFDTAGETVLVPFTNNNLYVMKFAPSDDGTMYLINAGDTPILYVPQNGYLENTTQPGARWYPFSTDFHPAKPVFLGVAPSWDAFLSIGWAPDLVIRGGYWSRSNVITGSIFLPSIGLIFQVGGHHYNDWNSYHDYESHHRDQDEFSYDRGGTHIRIFHGADPGYGHGDDNRGRNRGYGRGGGHGRGDDDNRESGHDSYRRGDQGRGGHVFRGADGDSHHDRR